MLDFNSSSSLSGRLTALVDLGMQRTRATQPRRAYLGASRLGASCERALQYEYADAPVDTGREIGGRMLRIFERGHVIEDCMAGWLLEAGFELRTRRDDGEQFGFAAADGRLRQLPAWVAATHLFQHATHHRGQVTTLLKQAGVDPGATDLPWMPGVTQILDQGSG